jgi:hypothetical protein
MEIVLVAFAYFGGPPGEDWGTYDAPDYLWMYAHLNPDAWLILRRAWRPIYTKRVTKYP